MLYNNLNINDFTFVEVFLKTLKTTDLWSGVARINDDKSVWNDVINGIKHNRK